MRTVEALKLLEVVEPKIVHRHHIALAPRVDALHAPKVHLIVIDVPIHGLKEDVQTMEIVVERRIAKVFLRAIDHHLSGLVIVAEARVVVIERVHPSARNGVRDIKTQRHMVRDQQVVDCHHELWCLHPNDLLAALMKTERGLVVHAAKHIDLVAHHTDASLKIDVPHEVGDLVVGTIGLHSGEHSLFVGRVHEYLVFVAAQDVLLEMAAFVEDHRIDGILRATQIQGIIIRQGDVDHILRNVEPRPVGAASRTLPEVVLKIIHAFGVLDDRLILLRCQHQGTVNRKLKLLT